MSDAGISRFLAAPAAVPALHAAPGLPGSAESAAPSTPDPDPQETAEWREAFQALVQQHGPGRARFVLDQLALMARDPRIGWSPELVTRAGVDASRLPELVDSMQVLGPLRPTVADALGLGADVVVAVGANDSVAAALGSGAVEPGRATVVMGTTGVLTAHGDHAQSSVVPEQQQSPPNKQTRAGLDVVRACHRGCGRR